MLRDPVTNELIKCIEVPGYGPCESLQSRKFTDLKPHPLNKEIYESLAKDSEEYKQLAASIREHGIQQPLIIKIDGTILSGHRRWEIAKDLLIEWLPCVVSYTEDDRVVLVEANRYRRKTASELMREAALIEKVAKEKADENQRKAGESYEKAEAPILVRDIVSAAIGMKPRTYTKLKDVYEASKTNENAKAELDKVDRGEKSINAAHKAIRALLPGYGEDEAGDTIPIPEFIRYFNSWQFSENDPRFGIPHPGRIPGQIAGNIIYYYTEPGDLVIDPMAGGGSTLDVAKFLGREAKGYDLHPRRVDIERWDITDGFPPDAEGAQLIFMDPPYWNMKDEGYKEGSSSRLSLEDFITWYGHLIDNAAKTVQIGGFVAIIIMGQYFRLPEDFKDGYVDWPFVTYDGMRHAGLRPWSRIGVTYPTSLHSAFDVENAKKGRHFLPILGDIVVGRRII